MFWTVVGFAFIVWLVLVLLFTPRIDYHVTTPLRPDSDEFLHILQSTCQSTAVSGNRVEILTNGSRFYPAIRDAIRSAQASINLEAYIFSPGETGEMVVDAMIERAQAGVEVRLVFDSIGSSGMRGAGLRRLGDAGRKVDFYQPVIWYRLPRLNDRT